MEYSTKHLTYIRNWFDDFKKTYVPLKEKSCKIFLLAISRKMPRFLQWMIANERMLWPESTLSLKSIIEESELITEHAIPFVFNYVQCQESEIIIIDDTIVTGHTLENVKNSVTEILGITPKESVILKCDKAEKISGSVETAYDKNTANLADTLEWLKFVSGCNESTSLPIDVEFPILHFPHEIKNNVTETIEENYKDEDYYVIDYRNGSKSVNVILDKVLTDVTTLQFSKARWFLGDSDPKLCIFSPFILSYNSLHNPELFESSYLKSAWQSILKSIPENADMHPQIEKSLAVMANYINSIVTYCRNAQSIVPNKASIAPYISLSDLQLLIGKDLALIVFKDITEAIENGETISYIWSTINTPTIISPTDRKDTYEYLRRQHVAEFANKENITDFDIQKALDAIFKISHIDGGMLSNTPMIAINSRFTILESYESLKEILNLYFPLQETDKTLNFWLDKKIDCGDIIPTYREVRGENGFHYWKRFFMSTYSPTDR